MSKHENKSWLSSYAYTAQDIEGWNMTYWKLAPDTVDRRWCNAFKTHSIQGKTLGSEPYTIFNIQFKHTLPKNKLKLQFDIPS